MIHNNENYSVFLVEETSEEGIELDLYHVTNNYTGVIEHRTFILPEALSIAEELNEAMIEFQTIYKPTNKDKDDRTVH